MSENKQPLVSNWPPTHIEPTVVEPRRPWDGVTCNTEKTLARMKDREGKVSWSEYAQMFQCEGNWFLQSNAHIVEREGLVYEDNHGLPGTIIQRIMETFINYRVYREFTGKNGLGDMLNWFRQQTQLIYNLIVYPPNIKFRREPRKYFRTQEGRDWVAYYKNYLGLDPRHKGFQPQFVNPELEKELWGSKKKFINTINEYWPGIVDMLASNQVPLNKTLSEVWLQADFEGVQLRGSGDFIINVNQRGGPETEFANIRSQLVDGYVFIDGKHRKSRYINPEQISFYATIVWLMTRRCPRGIGFWIWSEGKNGQHIWEYDTTYHATLKHKIYAYRENRERLLTQVRQFALEGKEEFSPKDLDLKLTPGQTPCAFCPARRTCPESAGMFLEGLAQGKREKEACLKHISEQTGEDNGGVPTDIHM